MCESLPVFGDWQVLEITLRGVAIGALIAIGLGFVRNRSSDSVRIAGFFFCLSVIAYVVNSSDVLRQCPPLIGWPLTFLSLGGGGYFWLFIATLFEDRRITPLTLLPAAVLTVVGFIAIVFGPGHNGAIWVLHNLIEIVFALHAFFIIYRSWRGDLVEARRRLRGPFTAVLTAYVIVLSGFEIAESLGFQASWYSLAGAVALAAFCLAGAVFFLEANAALFGAAEPQAADTAPRIDPADRLEIEKLRTAMDQGHVWRKEGLTIGALAQEIGVPEHRLRRLINDQLGHRNFTSFVNARRIEAAKAILSDPAQTRTTVAAVAFELGFGSLGPFNRAFKDATGQTPTQWRRQTTENGSPIPEISR